MIEVSIAALWCLVLLLTVAVAGLYSYLGNEYLKSRQARSDQGPPVGSPLSTEAFTDIKQRTSPLIGGGLTLIEFAATTCQPCAEVRPRVHAFTDSEALDVVVVCSGDEADISRWADEAHDVRYISDPESKIAGRFNVFSTPFFVLASPDGQVIEKGGFEAIEGAVRRQAGRFPLVLQASSFEN